MLLPLLLALTLPLGRGNDPRLEQLWTTDLGPGFSSVAVSGETGFITFRDPAAPRETVLVALDLASGAACWRHSFADGGREGQEDYGGGRGPHATPLVHRGAVIALGFGGAVHAFDAEAGTPLWTTDLVDELGAKPVQFGFAASPVAVGELVALVTGAPDAGVTAFDPRTGEIAWRSPGFVASYVTPHLARVAGRELLVCVTADETAVIDATSGREVARSPHPRAGLTNYAMALGLGDDTERGILVSGQGTRGARRLQLGGPGEPLAEAWSTRAVQFSHGRILAQDGFVYGSNGNVLCGIDATSGAVAFKVRAFGECGLVAAGDWVVALEEGGNIALLRLTPERIEVFARWEVLGEKSWAAPTVVGDRLYVRDAEHLVALRLPARADFEEPLEVLETGYVSGAVHLSPARIAFAHGAYRTEGVEYALVAAGTSLFLRSSGSEAPTVLTPRSEGTFETPDGTSVTLEYGEGPTPVGLELRLEERVLRAERVAWAPVALEPAVRARLAGSWVVSAEVTVVIRELAEGLEAALSPYPDVRFAISAESPRRLWLRATNASYGIPEILAEVAEDEEVLVFHQGDDTNRATRR